MQRERRGNKVEKKERGVLVQKLQLEPTASSLHLLLLMMDGEEKRHDDEVRQTQTGKRKTTTI